MRFRPGVFIFLAVTALAAPASAQPAPAWRIVQDGANLVQPVFWEAVPGASTDGGVVTLAGSPATDAAPWVDRYGPRMHVTADFAVSASLQAKTDSLATLSLVDGVPEDQWGPAMRRVEMGLQDGSVVFAMFDGQSVTPVDRQVFGTDAGLGPVTLRVAREGDTLSVALSGEEVARVVDPGVFATGEVLLGARVAPDNVLTVAALDVQAPPGKEAGVRIDRCTPTRLLAAGTDGANPDTGLWWIWPDDGFVRRVDPGATGRSYLVSVSPDERWVAYYQAPADYNPATDRFVVDAWVMDLETDARIKLMAGATPIGWTSDSGAVVLGEHPDLMVRVPSGDVVPTTGTPVYALSMRSALSPDQQLRAVVDRTPQGANGISVLAADSGDEVMHIPTGRGAPQLGWSPDSARLAFTSGNDAAGGLIWKLRVADLASKSVSLLEATQDFLLHSVLWAPPLPGCA